MSLPRLFEADQSKQNTFEETRFKGVRKFVTYMFILVMVLLTITPLYYMVVAATLPESALYNYPPELIPGLHFMENFHSLHEMINFTQNVVNSLLVATVYTVLSVLLCAMAGFSFAKYEFRFKRPLFVLVIASLVLPIQILVIPLFLVMGSVGWLDTFRALIIPWIAHPVGIFLMRQSMRSIPSDLMDSARIDGATEFQIFYRIALPAMKTSLAALAILQFLWQWNSFLYPLIILRSEAKFTIPVALNQLVAAQRVYYSEIMVAATMSIVPILILFLLLQRYFVKGIVAGAVKE